MPSAKVAEHIVVVIWTIDYSGLARKCEKYQNRHKKADREVGSPLAGAIKTWILRKVDMVCRATEALFLKCSPLEAWFLLVEQW